MVFTSIKVDEVERMKPLARSPRKRTAPRRLPRYAEQSRWSQLGGGDSRPEVPRTTCITKMELQNQCTCQMPSVLNAIR